MTFAQKVHLSSRASKFDSKSHEMLSYQEGWMWVCASVLLLEAGSHDRQCSAVSKAAMHDKPDFAAR